MNEDLVIVGTALVFLLASCIVVWWSGYVIAQERAQAKWVNMSMVRTVTFLVSVIVTIALGMLVIHYWGVDLQRRINESALMLLSLMAVSCITFFFVQMVCEYAVLWIVRRYEPAEDAAEYGDSF